VILTQITTKQDLMEQMTSTNGLEETNPTIGDNVTEFEKITPETYEKMNEEFEEEGLAFRIIVPTQKQIDDWQNDR
jgi:hypothetical protein